MADPVTVWLHAARSSGNSGVGKRGAALGPVVLRALNEHGPCTLFTLTRYIDRDPVFIYACLYRLLHRGEVRNDQSVRPQRWRVATEGERRRME